jgi:hypothetical protein
VLALDVADGGAVATLEHRLAELDALAARAATLHHHNCLLLESVLPENKKITIFKMKQVAFKFQ